MATKTKVIDKITDEQIARFPEWVKKWTDIGLSTEPSNFALAEEAVLKAYDVASLPRPKLVLHVSSPYAACYGGTLAWWMLKDWVTKNPNKDMPPEKMAEIKAFAEKNSLGVPDSFFKKKSELKEFKDNLKASIHNSRSGAFWASWGAYITFFRDVMNWQNDVLKVFEIDETLILNCGWVWWQDDVAVIADRPEYIKKDEVGRLHSEDSPSIKYRDGWSLYSWHGLTVPDWLIMDPSRITPDSIDEESNQEIRRAMIERYGYGKYVADAKIVHEDMTGRLRKKRNRKGDEIAVVEVLNGSLEPDGTRRTYFLSVPPQSKTAMEAVAWTYGLTEAEYKGLKVRT
jgi:hypothetical protein